MSDSKNGNGREEAAEGAQGQQGAEGSPSLETQIAQAEAEAADLKDRLLRALAEAENVRRRAERERDDARKYAVANFAKDLLDAADNLRRAIEHMPEAQVKDELTRNLLAGVAATERTLLAAFERHGIRRVDPKGER
ncbi:MAG TPA: nucleotide exchange factor GrpE, partial [Stellaceae bacterium]|nr:nucleotide exchange factor GrpE [Stellaceae bacterium]